MEFPISSWHFSSFFHQTSGSPRSKNVVSDVPAALFRMKKHPIGKPCLFVVVELVELAIVFSKP